MLYILEMVMERIILQHENLLVVFVLYVCNF